MVRMSHTAEPLGSILSRYPMVRVVSAVAAVLLALCGILWSATSRAGRSAASFGVTVRVLPHCDETRHGGLSETPDGRMVCVYPKILQRQVDRTCSLTPISRLIASRMIPTVRISFAPSNIDRSLKIRSDLPMMVAMDCHCRR